MIYPHLGGKLPSVLRPGKGRHPSDLIINVPTLSFSRRWFMQRRS
jgi:hypothetical protein